MTIYFDYSTMMKWRGTPTGIPRTVFCLANSLRELDPTVRFVAIDDDMKAFHSVDIDGNEPIVSGPIKFSRGDTLLSAGANWAFASYNAAVRAARAEGVRFFQLFYDIIPYLYPYLYEQGRGFGDYFGAWTCETLSLCDGSFAISECSKRDIVELAREQQIVHREVAVVRLGEDFAASVMEPNEPRVREFPDRFVLSVGTLELRKNQTCLLNAFRILHARKDLNIPVLVLVGRPGWIDGNILFQVENDRALQGKVVVLTDASDAELDSLYKRCLFTLFPAYYEGWGLPVAESLRHGKVCVSSNTSSMLEICPALTRFASPFSAEAWAEQIAQLITDPERLERESRRVREEYKPTAWAETAADMLHCIHG